MTVFGENGVLSSMLKQLDPSAVLVFAQVLILVAAYIYFRSLRRSAQDAALYALPRRRFLERYRWGQKALPYLLRTDVAAEHLDGRVDLGAFTKADIHQSPVARGSLWARGAKRFVDIMVSLSVLVFTLPLLLLFAGLIKLESKGPALYRQTRVGRHGRHFEVYKLRSMTSDAEADGAKWADKNDTRVTRIGRFIRMTRIDELPQTLNILKGDMSFVGPRPERPEFTSVLEAQIPHYNERHLVKPGLTGWAQVNYPYGASVEDARAKLQYDLYYLKHFSLFLDAFIIIKTVRVAIMGTGSR